MCVNRSKGKTVLPDSTPERPSHDRFRFQYETPPQSSAHQRFGPVALHPDNIAKLQELGFHPEEARQALALCHDSLPHALDLLLGSGSPAQLTMPFPNDSASVTPPSYRQPSSHEQKWEDQCYPYQADPSSSSARLAGNQPPAQSSRLPAQPGGSITTTTFTGSSSSSSSSSLSAPPAFLPSAHCDQMNSPTGHPQPIATPSSTASSHHRRSGGRGPRSPDVQQRVPLEWDLILNIGVDDLMSGRLDMNWVCDEVVGHVLDSYLDSSAPEAHDAVRLRHALRVFQALLEIIHSLYMDSAEWAASEVERVRRAALAQLQRHGLIDNDERVTPENGTKSTPNNRPVSGASQTSCAKSLSATFLHQPNLNVGPQNATTAEKEVSAPAAVKGTGPELPIGDIELKCRIAELEKELAVERAENKKVQTLFEQEQHYTRRYRLKIAQLRHELRSKGGEATVFMNAGSSPSDSIGSFDAHEIASVPASPPQFVTQQTQKAIEMAIKSG